MMASSSAAYEFRSHGIKRRSVKDRLGSVVEFGSDSFFGQQQHALKRQRQDTSTRNHIVTDHKVQEEIIVRKVVPETLKSVVFQTRLPPIVMHEKTVNMSKGQGINARSVGISDIKATSKSPARFSDVSNVKEMCTSQLKVSCPRSISETKANSGVGLVSSKMPMILSKSASYTTEQKKWHLVEDLDIPSFLQVLGLSKYLITFKVEEVDMFALKHMNDDDLKAIGLPMYDFQGPRKKILLALASSRTKK
ncbi:hypothetical protein IFM89_039742 [Coptis chinensis]|uniref:SAM domain-containing protein n=1 Tax=Coptis chinensis TaxID=261450 RepID=A0A835GSY4_9MAGN|nr:hypothetical protein IFM89_039742 [Coptis chinensis]